MAATVQTGRVTDVAYDTLRRRILERHFAAGERLHVDSLAAQLEVSRTPVREALNRLAAEGLVRVAPRSGTFVAHLSALDVEEVFDLREALEGLAVARVASRGLAQGEVAEFRRILDGAKRGASAEERCLSHAEANRAFHQRIISLAGNRTLARMYTVLNAHTMMALIHYASPAWQKRWDVDRREHERILGALQAEDPEEARAAMTEHLRRGKSSLLADMEGTATAAAP